MKLADIVRHLDALAPPHTAEAWDNVGLLVGDPAAEVTRAILCIDYTAAVADEAKAAGAQLVIAYHPPIFKPLKKLTAGPGSNTASALVFDAVRRGVALYSPHTALDVAPGGTNDVLADVLGLVDRRPLKPSETIGAGVGLGIGPGVGLGRIGSCERPTPRGELFDRLKTGLGVDHLLIAGPTTGDVRTVAVCAGACGDLLDFALAAGVDLYVTGEMRHHDALRAAAAGVTVVCTLHSHSERVTLRRLVPKLAAAMPQVKWQLAATDVDPFAIV